MVATTKLIAGFLGALALGSAGAGHAATTVYYLDVDGCAAGCGLTDYGAVTVTSTPGQLTVSIALANGVYFARGDNGLDAVAFNIADRATNATVATTGLPADFTATSPFTGSAKSEGPWGSFFYVVDWKAGATDLVSNLSFMISQPGNNNFALGSVSGDGQPIFFAVDVMHSVGGVVKEGVIGASTTPPKADAGGVPEPAGWALMITGLGLVGAGLRRRLYAAA